MTKWKARRQQACGPLARGLLVRLLIIRPQRRVSLTDRAGHLDCFTVAPSIVGSVGKSVVPSSAQALHDGEAVAKAIGVEPLTSEEIGLPELSPPGDTPLLLYVLKEAEVREGGTRLGPVGGRIVAEVLLGLIGADAQSYMRSDSDWRPILPSAQPGRFTMADLLRFADVA